MEKVNYSNKSPNPKESASILSSIFFWWTYYVIKKGRSVQYEVEDLPSPLQTDLSHSLGNKLEKKWQRETDISKIRGTKPSLLKTLVRTFWKEFVHILILHAFNDLFIAICKQVFLGLFLVFLRDVRTNENGYQNLIYSGVSLILFYGLNNLLQNHFICQSFHLGCRMKVALTSLIYRKCLRLGNNPGENTSAGMIVNLLSNDMRQFDEIIMFINYSWSGITSTILILILLSYYIGAYAAIAGFLSILLAMPAQLLISKALARNRIRTAYASDKRIQIMDEIICGIHIIKMYAWEKPYEHLIQKLRDVELKLIRKSLFLRGFQLACSISLSKFSMYTLIVVYACLGGDVLPEKVFVLVGYCSIIAKVVCGMGFRSFGEVSQCYISVQRIQRFLELKEFERLKSEGNGTNKNAVTFSKVKANWTVDSNRDTIKDLTLTIKREELTTIIGTVGSGKSSLLNVILAELPISGGRVNISGTISYYSQSPWIFAGTIRQNILFSQEFEQSRYNRVIEVCALNTDLKFLPHGDHTLVGERGITLSGGQKARISLARTIYRQADIYLLDDPLSAVDANVAKQIFDNCFLDFLKDKTRVLVTHQLQFLKDSDKVVLLHEGCVDAEGKFEDITTSKANYLNTLKKMHEEVANENEENKSPLVINEKDTEDLIEPEATDKKELEKEENDKSSARSLMNYVFNGVGVQGFLLVLFLCIIAQIFMNGCEIWLSFWTNYTMSQKSINQSKVDGGFPAGLNEIEFYVSGYSVIMIGVVITVVLRNCSFAFSGYQCAKKIHNVTFNGVLHANSAFFHNNPSGRILNRFSKDLGVVDNPFTLCLLDAVITMFQVVAAFIICSSINVAYLIPAVIAMISLIFLRQFYLGTSVTLKRLENITKSPVFVHVHATMQGLPTIRSNAATNKLIEQFDQYQDTHTSAWYLYNLTGFGYAYGLEVICLLYMTAIVIGCFYLNLSGSKVGLALAQVTILLAFAQWSMKQSAEVANQLTSVDRLLKYSSLPEEQQPADDNPTKKNWPTKGKIIFDNVSLRYNVGSAASICNVSFTVQPKEKVGIVGRTGAGKSSLLAALFRLGFIEGAITIDDVDTSTVRLEKLRSSISVIPQDPVLFSGTIRKNLDPFDEFDDADLWNAIDQAELKDTISKEEAGLDSPVSEGGRNFSVGQRQLICLARAILRNNKILVLDEATANVDQQTDSIIQRTIREKFESCTVLTIAHRLNTIVDSDKILVMDGGTAVEFGHPYKLLLNQKSFFYELVSKTGSFVAAALTGIAREVNFQSVIIINATLKKKVSKEKVNNLLSGFEPIPRVQLSTISNAE